MEVASRTALWSGGGKKWVNPYQTADKALIMMLDGEWNVANGTHDPLATLPIDICGNFTFDIEEGSGISYGDKSLVFDGTAYFNVHERASIYEKAAEGNVTVEIVFESAEETGIFLFSDSPRGLWIYGNQWNYNNKARVTFTYNQRVKCTLADTDLWKDGSKYATETRLKSFGVNMWIGKSLYVKTFKGKIYSLRIYNRKLTDAEILANDAVDASRGWGGGINV